MLARTFSHGLDLKYFCCLFATLASHIWRCLPKKVKIHDLRCERNWVQKSHCGLDAPGFCGGGAGALLSWLFESTEANSPLLRLLQCCLEAVEIEKRILFNGLFQDAFWV